MFFYRLYVKEKMKMKKNILTKEEKDYLEIVLKPFEINKIKSIIK